MNSLPGNEIIEKGYGNDDIIQKYHSDFEGYVNLRWLNSDSRTIISENIEQANNNLKEITGELKKAHYKNQDITILVKNKLEGITAANFLLELGIPVISSESLLLINSPKVMLLISALKFISDRKNDIATAELIINYNKYIKVNNSSNHELFYLIKEKSGNNLYEVLPESFIKKDGYLNPVLYNLNVYELTEHLINIFELDKIPDLYITKFLDIIRDYISNNSSDINSFIEWWQKSAEGYAISTPDNIDAVRILTIHKMKGLQNKVIIIPYASWEIGPRAARDYMWVSSGIAPFDFIPAFPVPASSNLENTYFNEDYQTEKDLTSIDNLNLLYVAFTRAEEALYIISYDRRDDNTGRLIKNRIDKVPELKSRFIENELKCGILPIKESEKVSEKTNEYKFISSMWQKKAVIRPSNYGIKPWEDRFDSVSEGILIHEILSVIKTKDEFENTVNDYVKYGMINTTKAVNLKQKFSEIISDEKIKEWFSGGYEVMNETEIINEKGSLIRPDRIMIKDDKVVLLDYKTGKKSKAHSEQMKKYIETVKRLGYNNIEGYILYLSQTYNLIQV
jgi:ATP-dependent exoDNAse (exonuclease V) beta subunit